MTDAIQNLINAQTLAMKIRPQVGGFPVLAEVLRRAGVTYNIWDLPSCQCLYHTKFGQVISQDPPLIEGMAPVPTFSREALIHAIRIDQAGKSTFPEFLKSAWQTGVVRYEVDFINRTVTYRGALGEIYIEEYPEVHLPN